MWCAELRWGAGKTDQEPENVLASAQSLSLLLGAESMVMLQVTRSGRHHLLSSCRAHGADRLHLLPMTCRSIGSFSGSQLIRAGSLLTHASQRCFV